MFVSGNIDSNVTGQFLVLKVSKDLRLASIFDLPAVDLQPAS
jgi:hypothetical protein